MFGTRLFHVYSSNARLLRNMIPQVRRSSGYSPHYQPIAVKMGGAGMAPGQGGGAGKGLGYPPTYNELPVPEGNWTDWAKAQNMKYNKILVVGLAMFVGTIYQISQIVKFGNPDFSAVEEICEDEEEPVICHRCGVEHDNRPPKQCKTC